MSPLPPFPSFSILRLVSWIFLFVSLAAGQSVHVVQVGWDGSFFSPSTVSALLNDTIRFVFAGNFHSVTQSSFEAPCTPLKGGFDSGAVKQTTDGQFPFWDLQVTNVSQPIWYFCEISRPASHCNAGMVGVINPPSIQEFNDFLASAKQVTGTPSATVSLRLTGIGALATAAPTLSSSFSSLPSSSAQPSSSTTSSSSSSPPSPTEQLQTSSGSGKSNKGGIIGGAVAGAIVLLLVLIFIFWWLRRKRDDATVKEFFNYRMPAPVPRPDSGFSPNMMMSSTGRRAIPAPAQPHYTTPAPVTARPRRRSFDGDLEDDSNRGSIPTYSSDAKSSTEGFLHSRPIPRQTSHPYMNVANLPSEAPPVNVSHLMSGSQHGHGGGSHQHALSNGSSSQVGHADPGSKRIGIPREQNPNPPSLTSIENPAPPVYQPEQQRS